MLQAIAAAVLILYAAIAWVVFRDYRHTRNIGFLIRTWEFPMLKSTS
jgi:hypothetical protein